MNEDICTLSLRTGPDGKFWYCFTCRDRWPCERVKGDVDGTTATD